MAVAGNTPTASFLTKIGKIQSAGCRLCRIAREARGESTEGLADETDGQINSVGCEGMATTVTSTVFGKYCECNAQKCTHLKRLPPLASHLLLLSHCVLTQHEGQKQNQNIMTHSGSRTDDTCDFNNMHLSTMILIQSNPMGHTFH